MSYFNELAGKPHHWPKLLLGSNIDCGQNMYELKDWCMKYTNNEPLYILCLPSIPPEKMELTNFRGEIPDKPSPGIMLISVNHLFGKSGKYKWLYNYDCIAKIGYSIWIYRIAEKELLQNEKINDSSK
jgi:hypothetical protein